MEMADIFHQYGPTYRSKYGPRMLPSHWRAMTDIERCRTEQMSGRVYWCEQCEQAQYSYHSCKNRHCPKCQSDSAQQWLERQQAAILPLPHFMVTFTLPQPLRAIARSNQRLIYNILFRAAAAALQDLALDPRFVGGQIALIGVLHTWARDLSYHPHVHFVVPGGDWLPMARPGFAPEKISWFTSSRSLSCFGLSFAMRSSKQTSLTKCLPLFGKPPGSFIPKPLLLVKKPCHTWLAICFGWLSPMSVSSNWKMTRSLFDTKIAKPTRPAFVPCLPRASFSVSYNTSSPKVLSKSGILVSSRLGSEPN